MAPWKEPGTCISGATDSFGYASGWLMTLGNSYSASKSCLITPKISELAMSLDLKVLYEAAGFSEVLHCLL